MTGDGTPDPIVAPGAGGGPPVKIIDGRTGDPVADFIVYEPTFTGGLYVAAGDLTGDGRADVIAHTRHGNDDTPAASDPASGTRIRQFGRTVDDDPAAGDAGGGGSGDGGGSGRSGGRTGSGRAATTGVEGTVSAADAAAGTVTVRRRDGTTVVVGTGPGTKIERNDARATLAAVKTGDAAEARVGSDGVAWEPDATGA